MSGYKLAAISITSEEYDRLCGPDQEVQSLPEPSAEQISIVGNQSIEILRSNLAGMRSRQEAFDTVLAGVNEQIRQVEGNTSRALVELETEVVNRSERQLGKMWQHFDQVISEYAARFDAQIQANARETQEYITDLYRSLRQMSASAEQKENLATQWVEAADIYCAYIKEYFNYEQFTPGRVEWLERQLVQTHENLEMGLAEAVIASAQQLVLSFSDLRVELERLQNEWVLLYQAAWEGINHLMIQVENCQFVEAIGLNGERLPSEINVDYWTGGDLDRLYAQLGDLRSQMENEEIQPDSELLHRWLEQDLLYYHQDLEEIVYHARIAVLNSQLRINVADLVVQALQEQGFILADSNYAEDDMRMAFGAQLENIEGNQVIIQVAPVGERVGENELHIQSMDSEERTERELEQRWGEISQSLNQYGVAIGQYTTIESGAGQRRKSAPGYLANNRKNHSYIRNSRGHGYRTSPPDHPER